VHCEVVGESIDVSFNIFNNIGVVNDIFPEVLVSGARVLGTEEEDWVDRLFALLDNSHNADGVGHLHLSALGVISAWGVKYAYDFLVV